MHSDRFGCLHSYMSQHKCIASSKKKICTHKNTSSQLTTDLKKKKKDERWHSSFFHCNEPLRLIAFIRLRNFQLTSPKKKSLYTVWLFANKTPRQPQVGCVSPRSILRHRPGIPVEVEAGSSTDPAVAKRRPHSKQVWTQADRDVSTHSQACSNQHRATRPESGRIKQGCVHTHLLQKKTCLLHSRVQSPGPLRAHATRSNTRAWHWINVMWMRWEWCYLWTIASRHANDVTQF